jgi:hypothetical protein
VKTTRDIINAWVDECYPDDKIIVMDGFDDAFVGIGAQQHKPPIAVYDRDKCIDILMSRDGMSWEDAVEFFDFNTVGAWVGEQTPLIMSVPYHTNPRLSP